MTSAAYQGYFADNIMIPYLTLQLRLAAPRLFLHKRFLLPLPHLLHLRLVLLQLPARVPRSQAKF